MDEKEVINKSVTAEDIMKARSDGAVNVVIAPANFSAYWNGAGGIIGHVQGATGLPYNGMKRGDAILSETPLIEDMWASAIYKSISKQIALGFTVTDDGESAIRVKQAQALMLNYDGKYEDGLSRHLRDFLTTDNGAFIEIVRQNNARGAKVIGLRHLDSLRCYRTGDPQRPVVYVDRAGRQHLLNDYDVISLTDMPSPRMEMFGIGICAARRAFTTILKVVAMETYFREKVSGSRNLAIHIVNGITAQQLEGALASSENAQRGKGFVVYRGSTLIPMLKDEPPSLVTIPLAEIADGYDVEQERKNAYLTYANAIGVFVGEIQPLSNQGLGTGTQSVVLKDSAEGTGLAAWRKLFSNAITHVVFPNQTQFAFATSDYDNKIQRADALSKMGAALKTLVDSQVISAKQALNVLVDEGYVPAEFLPADGTAGQVIEDDEKVDTVQREVPTEAGQTLEVETNEPLRDSVEKMKAKAADIRTAVRRDSSVWYGEAPESKVPKERALLMLMKGKRAAQKLADEAREA